LPQASVRGMFLGTFLLPLRSACGSGRSEASFGRKIQPAAKAF
jgi:hypothetical protein